MDMSAMQKNKAGKTIGSVCVCLCVGVCTCVWLVNRIEKGNGVKIGSLGFVLENWMISQTIHGII